MIQFFNTLVFENSEIGSLIVNCKLKIDNFIAYMVNPQHFPT